MRASFVIRWHTRRIDNLLQTLRFLDRWHGPVIKECEAILVCHDRCGDIDTGFKKTRCLNLDLPEMQNSKQTNIGVDHSSAETVVLLDGDRILPAGYFEDVFDQIQDKEMVTTSNMLKLTGFYTDKEIAEGRFGSYHEHRTIAEPGTRCSWSGSITFRKADFYAAGKMDENYVGYGWEDTDTALAMLKVGVKAIMREEKEIHLHHEAFTYGSKDQKKLFIQSGIRFCKKWNIRYPEFLAKEMGTYSRNML